MTHIWLVRHVIVIAAINTEVEVMLVITRYPGESFFVGDEIEVVILEGGAKVRVGINAPDHIEITRTELIPEDELVDDE